jgi:hypothetical protein
MAFTWTEDLPPMQGPMRGNAELELDYRTAIVSAINYLEGLRGKALPSFSGGTFSSALNQAAVAMEAVVMKDVVVAGVPRAQVLTVAVRVAQLAFHAGADDQAKAAAVKALLSKQ